MTDEEYAAAIEAIGQYLLRGQPFGTLASLLHAHFADNVVGLVIFDDMGSELVCRRPGKDIPIEVLMDLFSGQTNNHRWSEFEYFLQGLNFNIKFLYPDEVGFERDFFEAREEYLPRYFGNKPVRYPQTLGGDDAPVYTGRADGSWTSE